jgi:two-component system nitrogen regulation response regulator NtrX
MKGAKILVVDDESDIRALLDEILSEEGYLVTTAANAQEARRAREERDFDLVLLDIWMPDIDGITLLKEWSEAGQLGPVVMMSGHGTVDTAIEATRLGAVDFIEKPVSLAKLLRTVGKALAPRRGTPRASVDATAPVGKSAAMQTLRNQIGRVARHDAHTLFSGEPGSGREAAARNLLGQSARAGSQPVSVMSADLSGDVAEARLLGAPGSPGLLEVANGGVLLIHDLNELPADAQRLLLAALKDGGFGASGGPRQTLDLRILSMAPPGFEASNEFNQELLALLAAAVIRVPPLREYAEDVPELLRHHVDTLIDSEELPYRRFSIAAQNRLRNYPWPGNIRELHGLVKRLLIFGGSEEISLDEVEEQIRAVTIADEPLVKQDLLSMPLREAREHFERAYLQQQLVLCEGKVGQLAKRVGMERTHLYRKLRALGVDFRQVAGDE